MSTNPDIIKEFLVALGFKVDDKKLKKFTQGIDQATKFVGKLATGVEAMAVAAETAVIKVSSKFEDLYYASIRLNDSVENIRGTTFAIGQMGGTAQGGLQALENLAEFFRSNPGGERFVQGLGVSTRDATGQLRGMTEVLHDLGDVFRSMPYARAKVISNLLGIDAKTLQAMLRGTDEAQSRFHDLAQRMGIDQDKAAKASHDFMNDLRELLAVITLTADRLILRLQPTVDRITRGLEDLDLKTHGWSTTLIVLVGILVPLLAVLDPIVVAILAIAAALAMVDWSQWSEQIGDLEGALGDLMSALSDLGDALKPVGHWLSDAFGPVISDMVGRFFTKTAGALHEMADSIRVITDLLHGDWKKAWTDANEMARHDFQRQSGYVLPGAAKPANANQAQPQPGGAGAAVGNAAANVAAKIQDFFTKHNFTGAQARGMTAGIYAESLFNSDATNPTSGAYGIGQWLGARKRELFKRYGPHPTLDQQLEFMFSELAGKESAAGSAIQRQATASGALAAYVQKFMRPGPGTAGDMGRGLSFLSNPAPLMSSAGSQGAKTVSVNQKTEIKITTDDPHLAGKAVANEQDRVNQKLARDLKVAAS